MFSDPEHNVSQFGLEKGMRVADLGAGSGFYALAMAKAVGDKGTVYAVDIQKDLLLRLKNQAVKNRVLHLETVWGDLETVGGTKLRDGAVDRVLVSNILFQIEHKDALVKEVERILKPGGQVMVIDWADSFNNLGPAAPQVVPEAAARTLFEQNGFSFVRSVRAGDHHYGLIFDRP